MRDLFDDLLKEAKRHRHFENLRLAQQAARLARLSKPQVEVKIEPARPHYQLEAQGWYEARTILIVKLNHDHSLSPIGVYIEHLHPTHGRHLVPCPSLDTAPEQEVVTTWGDPRPQTPKLIESEEEIDQIRNRFYSLMEELDEEDFE